MSKKRVILQGDIYICNLKSNIGSEQDGNRPCLVIQINILNRTSNNVIVVPITSKVKKKLPTHIELYKKDYDFLYYDTNTVLCENIRSISKERLGKYIGNISKEDLERVLIAKEFSFKEKNI